jgi:type IV secretory pathway component VirB8
MNKFKEAIEQLVCEYTDINNCSRMDTLNHFYQSIFAGNFAELINPEDPIDFHDKFKEGIVALQADYYDETNS